VGREWCRRAWAGLRRTLAEVGGPLVARFGHPLEKANGEEEWSAPRRAGCAVVAMGKFGGRELNFSSDIDLIFLYSAEGMTSGSATEPGNQTFPQPSSPQGQIGNGVPQ